MNLDVFEKGDLVIEHLCDSFYFILLTKIKGKRAEGYIIDSTDIGGDEEDYIEFEKPYYSADDEDYDIDLDNCKLYIKEYHQFIINFHSTFKNYDNEKSGKKSNTVRFNMPEWKKEKLKESTHVKMWRAYTKEFFVRKITDKTEWENVDVVSWDSNEK